MTRTRVRAEKLLAHLNRARALFHASLDQLSNGVDASVEWVGRFQAKVLPRRVLAYRSVPASDPNDWSFLIAPAVIGFGALCAIAAGASLPSSPFKLEMAGTWFFGEPAAGTTSQRFMLFGLVAVYGGVVLLVRVWYGLIHALSRRPGVPVRYLGIILAMWIIPMLVIAPIFSRDVFSYAAQGEMMSRHINPYNYGPYTLGAGPYVNPVDPLWGNTPAPYGPLFLLIDGAFASLAGHHVLGSVILLRLSAVAGVALIAICMPALARSVGRDHGPIFVLAVLNPLVILTLVGAGHNDALMLGLLVAGITLARTKRPMWGVVLCALAAAVKVPAALGIVYIGWGWLGAGVSWKKRIKPLVGAGLLSLVVMLALAAITGLGMGWVKNLATPGTVRSWLAPATGIGMGITALLHAVGIEVSMAPILSVTRVLGLMGAALISVRMLFKSDANPLRSIGLSLLAFVVLGPVVQPWYLTWGVILLAPVALGNLRRLLVVLSALSPFIGLPGGRILLDELIHYNPLLVAAALIVLLGVVVAPLGKWSESWTSGPVVAKKSLQPQI